MRIDLLVFGIVLALCGAAFWGYFYSDEQKNTQHPTGSSGGIIQGDQFFEAIFLALAAVGVVMVLLGLILKTPRSLATWFEDERRAR